MYVPWGEVLDALQFSCSVVAKWRIWCGEAGFEQQIVWSLVAHSVGVFTPRPEVRILDWLNRQLGLESLGSCQDWPSQQGSTC